MTRKRVHALYPLVRAPDGSAFTKCEFCEVSLPIALADMHDCEETKVKRRRNTEDKRCVISEKSDGKELLRIKKDSFAIPAEFKDQPRSPFCFFMEEYSQKFVGNYLIGVSQLGFEAWKNMSFEERCHYCDLASKVNWTFEAKIRKEEIDEIGKRIDDEASSSPNIYQCEHDEDLSDFGSYSSY